MTTRYVIYETATGNIARAFPSNADPNTFTFSGESVIEDDTAGGTAGAATHYVLAGVLTAYTAPQAAAKATKPGYNATWNNNSMTWTDLRNEAEVADQVRAVRDTLLRSCDFTQLPDVPLTAPQVAAWAAYRALLRVVPEQDFFPFTIDWPTPP